MEHNVRPMHRARSLRLLAAGLLAASVVLIGPIRPTYASGGTVSGVVFNDYNANGIKDTREPGVGGVSVTEIDATGATTTAITSGAGTYSLTVATFPARIEFTSLPANYASGPHGTDSGTTTQFVGASTTTASLGINVPSNYCDNNPGVSTSCYVYGNQLGVTTQPNNGGTVDNSSQGVIVHFKYLDTGTTMPMAVATAKQVGTTFGLAYQQSSDTLYAAAFFKRHAGLGPNGLGAIYKITSANTMTPGTPALLTTVPNAGTDPRTGNLTTYDFFHDSAAFPLVGKIGLGGLKISADGQTLYTVNLNDRKLYSIPIASPNAPTGVAVPQDGTLCNNHPDDIRPFGLGVDNNTGTVYLGEVCTAQTSGLLTDMRGLVYSFNPGAGVFSASPVLNFSLNYNRNCAFNGGCSQDLTGSTAQNAQSAHFHPWTDTFAPSTQFNLEGSNHLGAWPQAILSDIAVDNGSLTIALRNRYADQTGYNTGSTDATDNTHKYQGIEAGGLLRAAPSGSGTFSLVSADTNKETFYTPVSALGGYHQRAAMGSVLMVPGFSDTMSTLIDPLNTAYTGGTRRFNADLGTAVNSYQIYGNNQVSFGKAAGLGGLTALCTSAPIEIGNRVWSDTNGNGIQDPGEAGIAVVTVQLLSGTGTVIARATTDSKGEYYFSSAAGTTTSSAIYGLSLTPNTSYKLRIANFATQTPLNGLVPTTANNAADIQANSKGVTSGTDVVDSFNTLGAGVDDHTQDFGFKTPGTGTGTGTGTGGASTPEAPSGVLFGVGAVAVLAALMRRRALGQRRMGL